MNNIWVRCGDQDDYHKFASVGEVADYLASMQAEHPLRQYNVNGVYDPDYYKGNNYISLYWGGDNAEDVQRGFSNEELAALNKELERSIKDRD